MSISVRLIRRGAEWIKSIPSFETKPTEKETRMAKFLFIYRDAPPTEMPSPEVMQAVLSQWGAWIEKFMKTGEMLDPGDGLKPEGRVVRNSQVMSDGPYMESKEIMGGYSIISAPNFDAALNIAMECPAAKHGGSLEIRELAGWV
jgi:hypothetical protein